MRSRNQRTNSAAQLAPEADTARRWPGSRAALSTYKNHGVTAVADRQSRLTQLLGGNRRSASASARGPWPCSLGSSRWAGGDFRATQNYTIALRRESITTSSTLVVPAAGPSARCHFAPLVSLPRRSAAHSTFNEPAPPELSGTARAGIGTVPRREPLARRGSVPLSAHPSASATKANASRAPA